MGGFLWWQTVGWAYQVVSITGFWGAIRITAWIHYYNPACGLGRCSVIKLCFLENPLDWKIVELMFLDLVVRVEMSKLEEMIVLIFAKYSARIPCYIHCGWESDCQSWGECKALYKPDSSAAFFPTLGVPGKLHLPNFCWACLWKQPRHAVGRKKRTLTTLRKGNRYQEKAFCCSGADKHAWAAAHPPEYLFSYRTQ